MTPQAFAAGTLPPELAALLLGEGEVQIGIDPAALHAGQTLEDLSTAMVVTVRGADGTVRIVRPTIETRTEDERAHREMVASWSTDSPQESPLVRNADGSVDVPAGYDGPLPEVEP